MKWILDFLTCRLQAVRTKKLFYPRSSCHPQAHPKGMSCPYLLYILFTNDCRSNYGDRNLLKFADDTIVIILFQDGEVNHGPVVKDFVEGCYNHFLKLNVHKLKIRPLTSGKHSQSTFPTIIKGSLVETVPGSSDPQEF